MRMSGSRPNSLSSSADSSNNRNTTSEISSSNTSQLNSSLLRTAAALSPASTNQTSLLNSPRPPISPQFRHSTDRSQCSDQSSRLFSLDDQDLMSFSPTIHPSTDDQNIEELLSSLGYQNQVKAGSRAPLIMQAIDGQQFSIHEHSLSPVSERTELDTSSFKTSSSKNPPLVRKVLAQRLLHPTQPLNLSPGQRLPKSAPSLQSPALSPGRPSIHRIPKKTSQLIRLFENNSPSSPNNKLPPYSPQRIKSPHGSSTSADSSPKTTPSSLNSPAARSNESFNSATIPEPSMTELECLRARQERRERIAMATKHGPACSTLRPSQATMLVPPSPMSDHHLKHRKSVASSVTSKISDVQVLHSGLIWYRNPQTHQWKETRGILTTEAVYLMNENGKVDENLPDQSIELNLRGCISVESVRSKRSYGPDFAEPHLHILRISWAEFDPQSNSRTEYEEFLGCSRATQRADWVGAIWQAAHDLGGFVDQPDIPLRRDASPSSVQPKKDKSPRQSQFPLPDLNHSNITPSVPSAQASSPRLDPISLVDRSVSIDPTGPRQLSPVATAPHSKHSPSQLDPPAPSLATSHTSELESISTNLQSEVDRELLETQQAVNPPDLASTQRLYSDETLKEMDDVDLAFRSYPIDPNLERKTTRPPSPELDIFAMLDRMSISGSIHRNTAQFYDPPPVNPQEPPRSHDMHASQPNIIPGQINTLSLDPNTDHRRRSSSQHSYHTIRPTSAAGIHDKHFDSPRSSALGLRSIDRERLSEVVSTTKRNGSQSPKSSATSSHKSQLPTRSSSPMTPKGPYNKALLEPTPAGARGRGAWSDTDRLSNQTDNILISSNPARAVQRDLRRILKTIERNDSHRILHSQSLGNNLDSIQNQLQNVADKLRGHPLERESNCPVNENDEPTIADKVDYMLSLCNILLESQHKVSSAVEKNLRAHGVSVSNRSALTRSRISSANPTRRSSCVTVEPGMPGPAPLTPQSENNLDVDQPTSPGQPESLPLPHVPDPGECEESSPNAQEPSPSDTLPPVVVQEAGLSRIENLLVALLSRMDESAQRQQPEPQEPAPPVPEKDTADGNLAYSQSCLGTEIQSESLDLDADVALWKSRGKGGAMSDILGGTCNDQQSARFGESVTSHPPSVYPPTEPEIPSTQSDQYNQQVIPDYNLAYEAEDEVARRIADERARAARRLEGISTPFNYRQSFSQNLFPSQANSVRNRSNESAAQVIPPNQDQHDPYKSSAHSIVGSSSVSAPPQPSYWSSTTPTAEDSDNATPPPPPPKDHPVRSEAFSQPALSTRVPSRALSGSVVSRKSVAQSHKASASESGCNPPPISSSHSQIITQEIRHVITEALQQHSTEQAPVLDEVVTLLRTQDQVSQASVLNQAEVSRYLGQLNVHLEGVLHKKNEEIQQIGENVGKLEKQLAFLVEQSEKISSTLPLINTATSAPPPPPEQAPTSIDQPLEEVTNDVGDTDPLPINPDVDLGDPHVDVSVHPLEGDALDFTGEGGDPHVTLLSNKPSVGYKIHGPRARKISFGKKGIKGPRLPTGLSSVGKLWGGPIPVADRSARWGTTSIGGGGSLKRVPTKTSQFGGGSDHLTHVEGVLAQVNPDDPAGQQALSQMDPSEDDRSGTIALGVSHILKFLRENAEKEELRRQKKEAEKANQPQPAIPDEMEQRRAKIEELQLRREATLAEDKAKRLEAMMQAMKQQTIEHDKLLKKIAEEMENKKSIQQLEEDNEEELRRKKYEEAMDGVNKVLTTVESGVLSHLEDFKTQMLNEMKQTFEKVGELREQKQQIQADLADMLAYMSKVKGGAPDPRWQYQTQIPPNFKVGTGNEGSIANFPQHLSPIPEVYPTPPADFLDRDNFTEINHPRSVSGFGPRPPGPR